ncbi:MAG: protein jag [Clostridia bacterium]|nr:protein jag [Clostridia bacterium]
MIKEAIGVADTIEEAKEQAMAELNLTIEDDYDFEIIATPKKKTFGLFGGSRAQVKVWVEVADPKPAKQPKHQPKKEDKKREPKAEKQVAAKANVEPLKVVAASEIDAASPAGKAVKYLQTILAKLGCEDVAITVAEIEGGSQITLTGEGLGVVIGHRGETLDALQYLASLAANAGQSGYYRVVLNTGDFREKREQTLIALAKRMAEQSIRSGKCRTLEPMNPYERRIIHTTIQSIEGVTSTSFGEGSNRRVVIAPEGKEPRPRNDYRKSGRGAHGSRGGRNDRRGGGRREAYKPQIDPERTPVKDAGAMPLYGRIDK